MSLIQKIKLPDGNTYDIKDDYARTHKQDTLVSGTNIKTINNNSVLGEGNIDLGEGVVVITNQNTTVTTDDTKGVAPYNTSYGYTNITISGVDEDKIKAGMPMVFECSGSLVVASANRNTRIRFGENGTWYPFYYTTSIANGSSYIVNGHHRILVYSDRIVSTGAIHVLADSNTTYSPAALGGGYGTCSTAAGTAAKVVTLSNYTLVSGGIVTVKFTYDVPTNATMNINSKGAKNIFYNNAKITSGVIHAGDIATFVYDGTQYRLISINTDITKKQEKLVSGTNIKTINGESVLGSGDITVGGSSNVLILDHSYATSNPSEAYAQVTNALADGKMVFLKAYYNSGDDSFIYAFQYKDNYNDNRYVFTQVETFDYDYVHSVHGYGLYPNDLQFITFKLRNQTYFDYVQEYSDGETTERKPSVSFEDLYETVINDMSNAIIVDVVNEEYMITHFYNMSYSILDATAQDVLFTFTSEWDETNMETGAVTHKKGKWQIGQSTDWQYSEEVISGSLNDKEDVSNKKTTISGNESSDTYYPTTKAVYDALASYYKKTETYTQAEVNALVSAIPKFAIEVVTALPETNISPTTIYLLLSSSSSEGDMYDEYIYVNSNWEKLGSQTIDLTDYATKDYVDNKVEEKLPSGFDYTNVKENYASTSTYWSTTASASYPTFSMANGDAIELKISNIPTNSQGLIFACGCIPLTGWGSSYQINIWANDDEDSNGTGIIINYIQPDGYGSTHIVENITSATIHISSNGVKVNGTTYYTSASWSVDSRAINAMIEAGGMILFGQPNGYGGNLAGFTFDYVAVLKSKIVQLASEEYVQNYVAEYGKDVVYVPYSSTASTSTVTTITNALNSNKSVILNVNNQAYAPLVRQDATNYYFLSGNFQGTSTKSLYWYYINKSTGVFGSGEVALELSSNKKTTITGNESSTTYYPTTKAVVDYVASHSGSGLPEVTTADAGKFLRVSSSGAWAVESVASAEDNTF